MLDNVSKVSPPNNDEFCQAGQDTFGMGVLTKKVTANVTRNGLSDS